ncbi:beta-propeller domain-containing protein [Cytobacillus purgationiresistens]|uniref:Secreted protein with C-terminal beta-propeller domain n=1 Tax=Cytobacillus purgationiresistens TaxID=863449 RepID=A0ABU0AAV4_9BACI|nr:beta-propeller domain-containing protein [Cytobacillus purgationiresistens]MDQ0268379.1 putative secreted protein with C-terminal beta-propeller domain [Cytobacillus purgationiresistens]
MLKRRGQWLVIFGMIFFSIIVVIYQNGKLKIINDFTNDQARVMANKVWQIQFNDELSPSSVNESTVYVLDNIGKKQEVSFKLSENKKAIIILPPDKGYKKEIPSYELFVSKEIMSHSAKKLGSSLKQTFNINEELATANSIQEINDHFIKIMKEQSKGLKSFFREDTMTQESSEMDTMSESKEASSDNQFSETNVQVAGIDESDMVKTDGEYIYQLADQKLQIIKAVPAEQLKLEKAVTFERDFSPYQLFLYQDQLIVIGNYYEEMTKVGAGKELKTDMFHPRWFQSSKIQIYNIADKREPKLVRELEVEGDFISARLMEGRLYLVTNHYPDVWILEDHPDIDLRPRYKDSSVSQEKQSVQTDEIQLIPDSKETNFTNIAAIDLDHPSEEMSLSTFLGSGNQLYMSKKNIYLATTNVSFMPTIAVGRSNEITSIYKIKIDGMNMEMSGSQEIEGRLLNQFSMDEHNGYFRVAVTKGQTTDETHPSSNELYIFNENLVKVGELNDLARGERIYSARFMGDKVYIVTFKETDPLFVIDASLPEAPKVLGELKIPGFSNYLHPYDENHLIGFGYDTKVNAAKATGSQPIVTTDGVKVTLFDVTDLTNPKEKFTEIIGGRGTYSDLNYDHKALLFDSEKNLFAFPISVYENKKNSENDSTFAFQGAYVYGIDSNKGFQLHAKITHQKQNIGYEDWESNINRILYIDDQLYSLSPSKITAHAIGDFNQTKELNLK